MAGKSVIRRWVTAIFDLVAAKKAESQFEQSLAAAGKKSGAAFTRELRAAFDKKMADLKVALAKGLISPAEFKKQGDLAARAFNSSVIAGMEKARTAGTITNTEYLKLARTLKKTGDDGAVAGSRIGGAFLKVGSLITGLFALNRIQGFLADSVHKAIEAQNSAARLDVVLEKIGLSYRLVSKEVEGYFDNLQQSTRFGDEDAREALVNLITITGDYRKSLSLLSLTADIASKRHTTMAEAAQTAADASKGLTKGMKDLGINAKDTGDIVGKLRSNLGGLAQREGSEAGGQLTILNNLLGEVKESFGDAILGGDGFTTSVGDLRLALIDLNTWVKQNKGGISDFVGLLVAGARAASGVLRGGPGQAFRRAQIARFVSEEEARQAEAAKPGQRVLDQIAFTQQLLAEVTAPRPPKEESEAAKKRRIEREKQLGAELERIQTEIAVRRLQLEQNLTEDLARELVRRQQMLAGKPTLEFATVAQVEAAQKQLDQVGTLAAAFDQTLIPALSRTATQYQKLVEVSDNFANANVRAAEKTATVWQQLSDSVADQLLNQGQLLEGLGNAFVARNDTKQRKQDIVKILRDENLTMERRIELERELAELGTPWLVQFAMAKVRENVASAIEWAAKALGMLAFDNFDGAAKAGAAAAGHTAAAAAWRLIGGSGGGGGGPTAGLGSGGGGMERAESIESSGDVHLYFRGPKQFSPEMEKFVYGNMQSARERFGQNANIHVHRDG